MSKPKEPATAVKISTKALYTVSFIEGAAVMGVELLGAKMIGPFFGNSLYVWASVLAITLAGLAGGYFLGGIVSKKYNVSKALMYVLGLATLLVLIMPGWANIIMKMTLSLSVQTATLMSCMLFLFPPLVCFGMVSPMIIHLVAENEKHAGKASGTVYGISTVGGIIMTILVGFYLIPEMGLRTSTYVVAAMIGIIPVYLFLKNKKFIPPAALVLLTLLIVSNSKGEQYNNVQGSYFKVKEISDGLQGQLLVAEAINQQANIHFRSLHINNISQTKMHVPTGRSQWRYIHRIALYSSPKPAGSRVLVCGLGGGNLINELQNLGFVVDVVEIDPRMEKVAKKWFFMQDGANCFVDDARHYIRTCTQKYDIVVLDMSAGENQPSNVYTTECFKEIQGLMNPDAVMFLHYQNVLNGPDAIAAKSIGKTLEESGFTVGMLDTESDRNMVNEIMFYASMSPLTLEQQSFDRRDKWADPFNFPVGDKIFIEDWSWDDGHVMTDDWPIMEHMHTNTLQFTRGADFRTQLLNLIKGGSLEFI